MDGPLRHINPNTWDYVERYLTRLSHLWEWKKNLFALWWNFCENWLTTLLRIQNIVLSSLSKENRVFSSRKVHHHCRCSVPVAPGFSLLEFRAKNWLTILLWILNIVLSFVSEGNCVFSSRKVQHCCHCSVPVAPKFALLEIQAQK